MQITKSKIQHFSTLIFILVVALMWMLMCRDVATAGSYTDSAHGSNLYGVNRSGTGYAKGDCVNCHDSCDNELMLFADVFVTISNQFCTKCHSAVTDCQPVTTNYPYCVTFGGYPDPYYEHIKKQITHNYSTPEYCGSRHNMKRIRNYVKNDTNGWGFGSDPSPCVTCHNPHAAKKNHPVAIVGGKLNTAIRRPSDHKSTDPADSLWGDDEGERMNGSGSYAASVGGTYQAPYYGDTTSGKYGPANDTTSDGSNLPDYVTFCLDCHQYEQFDPDNNRTVKAINYSQERHGAYPSNNCSASCCGIAEGTLKAPYTDFENSNYVLSCLDCHEPHGSKKRMHLLRRMINGQDVVADTGTCDDHWTDWAVICEKCHEFPEWVSHLSGPWGGCGIASCHAWEENDGLHGAKFGYPHGTCTGEPSF